MPVIPNDGLIIGEDGKARCWWHGNDPQYQTYHDTEWGVPVKDDTRLFEKINLEGFQAGLSWLTILRKRENFRNAFDNFNYKKIKNYDEKDIERLLKNAGIVRHRGKIESVINNARHLDDIVTEFGSFSAYIWAFEPDEKRRPNDFSYQTLSQISFSKASTAMSKDLKKRGWSFVGPTTCYAFMQSIGMVNDHVEGCYCRDEIEKKRQEFIRP